MREELKGKVLQEVSHVLLCYNNELMDYLYVLEGLVSGIEGLALDMRKEREKASRIVELTEKVRECIEEMRELMVRREECLREDWVKDLEYVVNKYSS